MFMKVLLCQKEVCIAAARCDDLSEGSSKLKPRCKGVCNQILKAIHNQIQGHFSRAFLVRFCGGLVPGHRGQSGVFILLRVSCSFLQRPYECNDCL